MKFTEGQQVEVIDCLHGHLFNIGDIVTIIEVDTPYHRYRAVNNNGDKWWVTDEEIKTSSGLQLSTSLSEIVPNWTSTRDLLQSILDNAVHIGGTDYRISEDVINKIREVLK